MKVERTEEVDINEEDASVGGQEKESEQRGLDGQVIEGKQRSFAGQDTESKQPEVATGSLWFVLAQLSRKVTRLLGSADENKEPDYTLGLRNVVKKERELLQCDDIITNLGRISSQLEGARLVNADAYSVSQRALEIIDSPLTKADFEREGKL